IKQRLYMAQVLRYQIFAQPPLYPEPKQVGDSQPFREGGKFRMKRIYFAVFATSLFAVAAMGQTQAGTQANAQAGAQANVSDNKVQASGATAASAQSNGSNAMIAEGTAINATLNSSIDSKKAKQGDEVTAHTTEAIKSQGKTVVPKGCKLVGH